VQAGDSIEVTIDKGVYRGMGLGRHEGRVILVRGAYPGERWKVRVTEVRPGYARGVGEEPLQASPDRRASACPFFPRCGGCAHLDLVYDAQLALKRSVLRDALERAGVKLEGEIPVVGSPEHGWRTRASLHVEARGAVLKLGLHEEGSHRLVDTDVCRQLSETMNVALADLRAVLTRLPQVAARVRRIELAEGADGEQRVAALVGDLTEQDGAALRGVRDSAPSLASLGVATTAEGRRRFVTAWGNPRVSSKVGEHSFTAHVMSFFQANRFLLPRLVAEVEQRMPPDLDVLDLYGGVGLFSISLARSARRVVCVEIDRSAIHDAMDNVRAAELDNVGVVRADVREALVSIEGAEAEGIVVDPPRTGLGADVIDALIQRRPGRIVYVSCDPPTLGRDLHRLLQHGYAVVDCVALDLFPGTFHVEAVVRLDRMG
jgi:23S rRNA (uracil1939-C5)-methyltransferase